MAAHQPPAQPKAVLRGHQVQVHAAAFVRGNQRLASGDADGYVVLWDLAIMRPTAVWRAHTNAILGIASWGAAGIITHGRDNQLIVWKVTADDEATLSSVLPLDPSPSPRPQPWVLHILPVNTMNFCSFALCPAAADDAGSEFLIAVPNTLASESVDIYHFPSQARLHTVHSGPKDEKNGMVMALALFYQDASLTLATSYENGLVMLTQLDENGSWATLYRTQCHSQPVLSLDVAPQRDYFLTSSADSLVVKHPIPPRAAPWPAPGPGPHAPATTLAGGPAIVGTKPDPAVSLLSAALASEEPKPAKRPGNPPAVVETQPLKVVNTKHAGQQGLRIRPDGRIFATAGWDSKVRVYSAKTMQELAVLKWHQVGCYAAAFADPHLTSHSASGSDDRGPAGRDKAASDPKALVPRRGDLTVKDRRIQQASEAHWLAAGSKDGKISLWDIY